MNQLQFSLSLVMNENIYKNSVTGTLDTASKVTEDKLIYQQKKSSW